MESAELEQWVQENTKSAMDRKELTFQFGKYHRYHILEVFEADPQYIMFIFENARHRVSPLMSKFIIKHGRIIGEAARAQLEREKDVFS